MDQKKKHIAIIGSGYAGTLSAIEIMKAWDGIHYTNAANKTVEDYPEINITLIEKIPERRCGGIAYSTACADAFHVTNIAANKLNLPGDNSLMDKRQNNPMRIVARHQLQDVMRDRLMTTMEEVEKKNIHLHLLNGTAIDLWENKQSDDVTIKFTDENEITADKVIIATGNNEYKELPCVTASAKKDPAFSARYVSCQWEKEERTKIKAIPSEEPVLIIGTALSAYDAVRTLLEQGHKGDIVMMSRNGLEHFTYPKDHDWKELNLPRPYFMDFLINKDFDSAAELFAEEFRELTGYNVDIKKGTVKRDSRIQRAFHKQKEYLPEQVLENWEVHIPEIVENIGEKAYGRFLGKYSALINTLRVGASKEISDVIKKAKRSGQLKTVAASISKMHHNERKGGINVLFKHKETDEPEIKNFHTVISSLGANYDFSKTKDPLWKSIIERGYTKPHPTNIGVITGSFNSAARGEVGRLLGSKNIYTAGVTTAGQRMVEERRFGPPAFSIPGMRRSILNTAFAAGERGIPNTTIITRIPPPRP